MRRLLLVAFALVGCHSWHDTQYTPWLRLSYKEETTILPHNWAVGGGDRVLVLVGGKWVARLQGKMLVAARLDEGRVVALHFGAGPVQLVRSDDAPPVVLDRWARPWPLDGARGLVGIRCVAPVASAAPGPCARLAVDHISLDGRVDGTRELALPGGGCT